MGQGPESSLQAFLDHCSSLPTFHEIPREYRKRLRNHHFKKAGALGKKETRQAQALAYQGHRWECRVESEWTAAWPPGLKRKKRQMKWLTIKSISLLVTEIPLYLKWHGSVPSG